MVPLDRRIRVLPSMPRCGPLFAVLLALPLVPAAAQSDAADQYVRLGLRGAFSQRQQGIDLELAEARRREARALSLPTLAASSITTRSGGNVIDVSRLLNPAYGALNQLLRTPAFPTDLNLRLPLQSQNFLRVTQPVFAPAAWNAATAAARAEDAQRIGRDAASRQLAAEIRLAWLTWYKANSVLSVYDAAVTLIEEQVRISERLVQAGVRAPDAVLRARAELSAVRQERLSAMQQGTAAGRRLNHLVAQPLDTPIAGSTAADLGPAPIPPLDSVLRAAREGREELKQLDAVGLAADAQRKAASASLLPSIALAFEYGFQGSDAKLNGDRDYRVLSVVSQWNIWGGGDRARVSEASIQRRSIAARRDETASLIELQVRTAHDAATVARTAVDAADDQLRSAERAFQLVRRRYEEGQAVLIEVLDARRAFTTASINRVVTIADLHARRVDLVRAAALEPGIQP